MNENFRISMESLFSSSKGSIFAYCWEENDVKRDWKFCWFLFVFMKRRKMRKLSKIIFLGSIWILSNFHLLLNNKNSSMEIIRSFRCSLSLISQREDEILKFSLVDFWKNFVVIFYLEEKSWEIRIKFWTSKNTS